jgi:methylated-DNA-[protein]-cysteine S-methyltransferase
MNHISFNYSHSRGVITGHFTLAGLAVLRLPRSDEAAEPRENPADARVWALFTALDAYFEGEPETFANIPLDLSAGTPFRQAVWHAAMEIPHGSTSTYGALAARIGKPGAARAVGQALGANPVPIPVPCHRFLAADGSLGGFSCGLAWKRALLDAEGAAYPC